MDELRNKIDTVIVEYKHNLIIHTEALNLIMQLIKDFHNQEIIGKLDEILSKLK
jgi:hypothetical protein